MKKLNTFLKVFIYLVVFGTLFYAGYKAATYTNAPDVVKRSRLLLGTVVEIQVRNEKEEYAAKAINEAFEEMKRIDNIFSVYDSTGLVYKLNQDTTVSYEAEGDIRMMLDLSDSIWRMTGGGFDVSLQNLTDIWGFNSSPSYPGKENIELALSSSGWNKLEYENGSLIKNGCKFNFGAIAKGYAVDRATEILTKYDIDEALVNAGGEIRATGGEWRIGIQDPDNPGKLIYTLDLNGMSVATSGDYEQYFEYEGKRYHHILDPVTGYPGNKCRSVTVISEKDYYADALATGIFIMGPEKGISLVESLDNTEVMIVDTDNKIWSSSGFNNYILR